MMRWLVGSSVRFRLLVLGMAGVLLLLGANQLREARVDTLPEFTPPYVEVQTEALGLSAEEVEELITVPLEADLLNGVAFLEEIRSESISGLSSIVMTFEPGTDIYRARQVVAERLTQAHALPNVSKPPAMLQPLSSENRVMIVSLRSEDLSMIDVSVLARWTIRPRLMGVPGVANVSIWGERNRQLQVLVDPRELAEKGVSLEHVVKTTGNALWVSPLTFLEASTPGTGGFIETPNQRLGIQHILPIRTPEDLARVVVEPEEAESDTYRIGEIATVVEDHQPLIGDAALGDGEGLLLVIEKFPGVNTLEVTRSIDEALAAMTPGLAGVEIDSTVFRPANFIEESIRNVSVALLIGFLLAGLTLGALLFDARAALIVILTIPLSLVAAALVLHHLGTSLNVMVMGGLAAALGVLVDDAVTSMQSVLHRLDQPHERDADRPRAAVIVDAVRDGRSPILYATGIVLVTLVPVFFVSGEVSAFLPPMAVAFGVAVLASLVVSLTVAPALAVLLLSGVRDRHREPPTLRRLRRRYHSTLNTFLGRARPAVVVGGVAAVGVAAAAVMAFVPQQDESALPSFKARELLVRWDGAPGTSRAEMTRIVRAVSEELGTIDGVGNVGGHVGRAILSDEVSGVDSGEIWVTLEPDVNYDEAVAAVRETVGGYPGLATGVSTYPQERIDAVLSAPADDVTVRVYGQDLALLREHAEHVRRAIARVAGVSSTSAEEPTEEAAVEVVVDLEAAGRHGVKAGDVRRAATTLLSGIEVGLMFEEQKVFEVVVWGKPEVRSNLSAVRNLLIETPLGDTVRLEEVADVRIAPRPSVITREGVMRILDIGVEVGGRDIGPVIRDIEAEVSAIPVPLEYHIEVFSAAAANEDAAQRLLAAIAAAVVFAFLLLQAAFARWRLALLVLLTLPAALAGGVATSILGGDLLSLSTLAGALTVLAITVRSVITLIDHYERISRSQPESRGTTVILRGSQERMTPTLTTAIGTALAMMPIAVMGDVAGLEVVRPMAIFVLGGLVTSTLITLFVIPALVLISGPRPRLDTETLLTDPSAPVPSEQEPWR